MTNFQVTTKNGDIFLIRSDTMESISAALKTIISINPEDIEECERMHNQQKFQFEDGIDLIIENGKALASPNLLKKYGRKPRRIPFFFAMDLSDLETV